MSLTTILSPHLPLLSGLAMAAAAVSFSGQAKRQNVCSKSMAKLTGSMPFKYTTQLEQNRIKTHSIFTKRANNRLYAVPSKSNSDLGSRPLTVSDTIWQFYTCINEKNLKQLGELISDDSCFDDCSFPKPFQGKKEVMQFLEQLTTSMGQNVKFNIGHICEGDDLTAGVDWHLEWKKKQIPFTRGCSFFACSMKGGRLKIKKNKVLIESPIKPGSLALAMLKTVTSLLDDFPGVAEWFLESPHVILQWILRIYAVFLRPFINPLLTGYINLWNFMARLISYTLKIMLFIYNFFSK